MKVDLLRQLDEWGTHLEENIEHVTSDEVLERAPELRGGVAPTRQRSPRWRGVVRYAGLAAVLVVLLGGVIQISGTTPISEEFNSVGNELGASSREQRTNAPTTAAASTTFAPDTTAAPAATEAPATTTTAAPSTTVPPGGTTIPPAGNNPANLGRAVIFVGDLAIDTRDVSESVTRARAIAESRGGYVFGQELGGRSTVMSLKVPAEFFQDTVDRLSELGTVRNARVTSEDVTERIVDIESQITTAETSVVRLQELLAEAASINTIARLESELLQRETTLERLRGQLRTLQDQVALSTIVITFREFVPTPDLTMNVSVHAVDNAASEECFTNEGPLPQLGESYALCVDITNTGNLDLTDIEIDGPPDLVALLTPVSGNRIDVLAVGDRYVVWTTASADETLLEEITVRAVPLNEEGQPLAEQIVDRRQSLRVVIAEEVPEPEEPGLPSLRDALAAGWNVVTVGLNALAVAFAFLLPLLWIPAIGLLVLWWRRRRSD